MRILFYGDSITDALRRRDADYRLDSYGVGYVRDIVGELLLENPEKYDLINRGIGGDRIVDLYARIKRDVWNLQPDVLSILVGINDIWHEVDRQNGVDLARWESMYRLLLKETLERLPNVKIVICEPFVLEGEATCGEGRFEQFLEVKEYAKVAKKLAEEFGLPFLPLQNRLDEEAAKHGAAHYLYDGVHPSVAGARLIANEWLKLFKAEIDK